MCVICHLNQAIFVGPYCNDCSFFYLPYVDNLLETEDPVHVHAECTFDKDDPFIEEKWRNQLTYIKCLKPYFFLF